MKKFGWCFIGTGTLANQVAKEILSSGKHKIVSCYTRNPDKCEAFAKEYDCKAYPSAEDAIMADGVEGYMWLLPTLKSSK